MTFLQSEIKNGDTDFIVRKTVCQATVKKK